MLHRHILVLHGRGDALGGVEALVHVLGHIDLALLPAGAGHTGQLLHLRLGGGGEGGDGEAHVPQQLGDQPALGQQQGQQQVGLLNLLVAVLGGDGLGVLHRLQGFLGIFLRVHIASRSFYKENQDFSRPNR